MFLIVVTLTEKLADQHNNHVNSKLQQTISDFFIQLHFF